LSAVAPGTLYVVATPIGNLDDATFRMCEVLREVDVIAAEDTRHVRKLLTRYDIPTRTVSLHGFNEATVSRRLVQDLQRGRAVAVVSDAGVPLISDPGFLLVREAIAAGVPVVAVPGPSAVMAALVVSGLPVNTFTFLGFPPRKPGRLRNFLAEHAGTPHTLVLFEAARRAADLLEAAVDVLGERPAALCLELTKMFEQVRRGTLPELLDSVRREPPRGELTLVVGGLTRPWRRQAAAAVDETAHE
jgi:16S rRNA (cytidine1402-2'-O)-methyltransferase